MPNEHIVRELSSEYSNLFVESGRNSNVSQQQYRYAETYDIVQLHTWHWFRWNVWGNGIFTFDQWFGRKIVVKFTQWRNFSDTWRHIFWWNVEKCVMSHFMLFVKFRIVNLHCSVNKFVYTMKIDKKTPQRSLGILKRENSVVTCQLQWPFKID